MPITLTPEEFTECHIDAETGIHWSELIFRKLRDKGAKWAIRPHVPGFVDKDEVVAEYIGTQTKEELFAAPYVSRWTEREDFAYWKEEPYGTQNLLVAHLKNGQHYVVAYWVGFED